MIFQSQEDKNFLQWKRRGPTHIFFIDRPYPKVWSFIHLGEQVLTLKNPQNLDSVITTWVEETK